MMSKKQLQNLAKKVYGKGDQHVKDLETPFRKTQRDIIDKITAFIADKKTWSAPGGKSEIKGLKHDIKQLMNKADDNTKSLLVTALKGQPAKTNGDVLKATTTLMLVNLATYRNKQIANVDETVPPIVHEENYKLVDKAVAAKMPDKHPTPAQVDKQIAKKLPEYGRQLQRQIHDSVIKRSQTGYSGYDTVNKDTLITIHKIQDICDRALKSKQDPINYKQEVADVLTGGDKASNGAMGRASNIVRTHTARLFNQTKMADYRKRNVECYKFVSLEAPNTCAECDDLDGKIFNIDDAVEGVNYPPIHNNCQCDTQEVTEDDDDESDSDDELVE